MNHDFEQFFLLSEAFRRGALRVECDSLSSGDPFGLQRGYGLPGTPIPLRRSQGKRPHDLVGSTLGLYFVSPRLREVFANRGISGWGGHATVPLAGDDGLVGYELFVVRGRCGRIDDTLSERAILPAPAASGKSMPGWKGLYFDLQSWDGADVFVPDGSGFVIVTARVRCAVEEQGLSNIQFRALPEIERLML